MKKNSGWKEKHVVGHNLCCKVLTHKVGLLKPAKSDLLPVPPESGRILKKSHLNLLESGNATILILKETRERVLVKQLFQFGLIIGIETDFCRQFVGQNVPSSHETPEN